MTRLDFVSFEPGYGSQASEDGRQTLQICSRRTELFLHQESPWHCFHFLGRRMTNMAGIRPIMLTRLRPSPFRVQAIWRIKRYMMNPVANPLRQPTDVFILGSGVSSLPSPSSSPQMMVRTLYPRCQRLRHQPLGGTVLSPATLAATGFRPRRQSN